MATEPSRRATLADLPALTETIGLAFADDPVWGHAFAGAKGLGAGAIWRIWIEGALRYDWVWMTAAAEAVSIWIPQVVVRLDVRMGGAETSHHLVKVGCADPAGHPPGPSRHRDRDAAPR